MPNNAVATMNAVRTAEQRRQPQLAPVESVQTNDAGQIMEEVIAKGDLAKLSPEARARYYVSFCESVGLNPFTQPLSYLQLNGRLVLYALKGATDQLRRVHGVSVVRVDKELVDDLFIVTVAVRDATGRVDEDMGATVMKGLAGEAKVNAMLKAITKAKRRATLSLCGLGLLDESEVESISGARIVPVDLDEEHLAIGAESTPEITYEPVDENFPADQEPQPAELTPIQQNWLNAIAKATTITRLDQIAKTLTNVDLLGDPVINPALNAKRLELDPAAQ